MTRFVLALVFAVSLARAGSAQDVDRSTPASSLSDLHPGAAAAGYADVDALRALPWFEEVVRHALADQGVGAGGIQRALLMLGHTHSAHASLVRGSGDLGIFAAVVVHGDYARMEVPNAVQAILPGLLAGLWYATTIDGHRAYDMGVAALIELTPNDWILARRVHQALPMPGATPSDDLRRLVEAGRALGASEGMRSLAYGVLDGPDAILPGQNPPTNVEQIFRGPREALAGFGMVGDQFVVHWDVTLHHVSDATRWETHYRNAIAGMAARLHVPESTIRFVLTRTDTRLVARVELDRAAADAFVAELVGRALPPAPSSATSGAGAPSP